MFTFLFDKLEQRPQTWKIIINGHEISCAKSNAKLISQKIFLYCKGDSQNNTKETTDFFEINIQEFENTMICSELDYNYFHNIFNLIPIQISMTNKDVLKIFAKEFEIEELSKLIQIFERSNDIMTTNSILRIQNEITKKILDITEENYGQLIDFIIEQSSKDNNNDITNNDFIYNAVLSVCKIRPQKTEILITFLKELEERTKGTQFQYFKEYICQELKIINHPNEISFVICYLYNLHEIDQYQIKKSIGELNYKTGEYEINNFKYLLFDQINTLDELFSNYYRIFSDAFVNHDINHLGKNGLDRNMSAEQLMNCAKSGSTPNKIYEAIKNDDIETFSDLINSKSSNVNYNDEIEIIPYDRHSFLMNYEMKYIDFSAFFGSEKIFNYILLNVDSKIEYCINIQTLTASIYGGNPTIIRKCLSVVKMDLSMFKDSLLVSLTYNHNDVFEWLVENQREIIDEKVKIWDKNIIKLIDNSFFLKKAIEFNNFDALFYLISIGIDYTPLFSLSLLYNNFYLAKLSLELDYSIDFESNHITKIKRDPFLYLYNDNELPLFIAIYKNRLDFVKIIINQNNFNPSVKYQETNPLCFAAIYNKPEIFKFFLEKDLYSVDIKIAEQSLFDYAIQKSFFEIAFIVSQHSKSTKINASFDLPEYEYLSEKSDSNPKNYYKMYINKTYSENIIRFFIDDKNDNELKNQIVQENKEFIVCTAARFASETEFVQLLEKYNLEVNYIIECSILFYYFYKLAPLLSSVLNEKHDVLKIILTKYKDSINVNYSEVNKLTSLHLLALQNRSLRQGDELLLNFPGIDVNKKEKTHNYTPLHLAILNKKEEIIRILLENPEIDVNAIDIKKNNALHFAFAFRTKYTPSMDLEKGFQINFNILKLLIECPKKVDILAKNDLVSFCFFLKD